jgi:hypothetical protein
MPNRTAAEHVLINAAVVVCTSRHDPACAAAVSGM